MKILIVDDNVAVQEIIKDILAEEGHDAHVASSVDEAVLKIGSFDPDIVMLDTWVGNEDGLRVINRCRENREDRPLNVILIKSLGEQVPKDNPYIRGYIDKPFKSTDVLTVLKNVIDIIRTEEEQNSGKKGKKKKKLREILGGVIFIAVLVAWLWLKLSAPSTGYYCYDDDYYYYQDSSWYTYDSGGWYRASSLDGDFKEHPDDYWLGSSYSGSYDIQDFEDSSYYHESSNDSSSDVFDSWDSSDTDWDSDW